jgi:apolipoprotein N-acyltransferase
MAVAIALGSGLLMGFAPAPVEFWPGAWFALAPLWVLVILPRDLFKLPLPPILCGFLWGLGYHGLALSWITGIHPMTWMGVNWWASLAIALVCWALITLWGAVLVAIWSWGMARLSHLSDSPWLRLLWGVTLWCALESLWQLGPLWWTALAYTQSPYNLVILHLGQLSGPLAITAVIVLVNGLVGEAGLTVLASGHSRKGLSGHRWTFWIGLAIASLVLAHGLGWSLYQRPLADAPEQAFRVGIIQGNVPNTIKLYEEGWRRSLNGYTSGYQTLVARGVDVVLTPETALPVLWTGQGRAYRRFIDAVQEAGIPVWLGAFGQEGQRYTNSLFMVSSDGTTLDEYRKIKLVPLGEYIPFERWIGRFINRLSPLDAHLFPGAPDQTFDTPFGRAIAAICYESAFAEIFRYQAAAGGEFILTASNNAHYSATMPAQHHAQDVMRAIESDRWAARATNTGYSGIIDPHGRTLWVSGINTYELYDHQIYRRQTQTPYVRWGNWLTPVLLIASGSTLAWAIFTHSRRSPKI